MLVRRFAKLADVRASVGEKRPSADDPRGSMSSLRSSPASSRTFIRSGVSLPQGATDPKPRRSREENFRAHLRADRSPDELVAVVTNQRDTHPRSAAPLHTSNAVLTLTSMSERIVRVRSSPCARILTNAARRNPASTSLPSVVRAFAARFSGDGAASLAGVRARAGAVAGVLWSLPGLFVSLPPFLRSSRRRLETEPVVFSMPFPRAAVTTSERDAFGIARMSFETSPFDAGPTFDAAVGGSFARRDARTVCADGTSRLREGVSDAGGDKLGMAACSVARDGTAIADADFSATQRCSRAARAPDRRDRHAVGRGALFTLRYSIPARGPDFAPSRVAIPHDAR